MIPHGDCRLVISSTAWFCLISVIDVLCLGVAGNSYKAVAVSSAIHEALTRYRALVVRHKGGDSAVKEPRTDITGSILGDADAHSVVCGATSNPLTMRGLVVQKTSEKFEKGHSGKGKER